MRLLILVVILLTSCATSNPEQWTDETAPRADFSLDPKYNGIVYRICFPEKKYCYSVQREFANNYIGSLYEIFKLYQGKDNPL